MNIKQIKNLAFLDSRYDFNKLWLLIATVLTLFMLAAPSFAAPTSFSQSKALMKQQVYLDQNIGGALGTIYCGCDWEWTGRSGGRINFESCGYEVRAQQNRAQRIEWEHIVPASWMGNQRQCWQNGGRKNCTSNDAEFSVMEADMHNLSPSIGEVNADRSNYRLSPVAGIEQMYGQCKSKTDFKARAFEPRDEAKGLVARVNFYIHDRYNLNMSRQQQQVFMAWDKQFPVTAWELERDQRIAKVMGHSNAFVTGKRSWTLGHKNTGDGLRKLSSNNKTVISQPAATNNTGKVHGNKNSKIYHLPSCPSYKRISQKNIVEFDSEKDAEVAGYRKAKNCM